MGLRNLFVGTLYENPFNGVNWSQPGGPGTPVFPQQQDGPFLNYPVPGQFFIEATGFFTVGCGHWVDYPRIFRDYDEMLDVSTGLVCCPMCSYIQYLIQPYELVYDVEQNPVIII